MVQLIFLQFDFLFNHLIAEIISAEY